MGKKKVLAYAGVWGIVMIGFYLGFWRPRIINLNTAQSEMATQEAVIKQLRKDIETYPKTITAKILKEVEGDLDQLFARIPAKEELPAMLNQVRDYSVKGAKLKVISINSVALKPGREPQHKAIPSLAYQITVEGNTRDVIRFMYELENGVRLIAVDNFMIRRIKESPYSVRADFTIKIFHSNRNDLEQELSP